METIEINLWNEMVKLEETVFDLILLLRIQCRFREENKKRILFRFVVPLHSILNLSKSTRSKVDGDTYLLQFF